MKACIHNSFHSWRRCNLVNLKGIRFCPLFPVSGFPPCVSPVSTYPPPTSCVFKAASSSLLCLTVHWYLLICSSSCLMKVPGLLTWLVRLLDRIYLPNWSVYWSNPHWFRRHKRRLAGCAKWSSFLALTDEPPGRGRWVLLTGFLMDETPVDLMAALIAQLILSGNKMVVVFRQHGG